MKKLGGSVLFGVVCLLLVAMNPQKKLGLKLERLPGEPQWKHKARQTELNHPVAHVTPEKLLADLLKRKARQIMCDITECPPDTLPAHLARLDDHRDVINHCLTHWLCETAENRLSGSQLAFPVTVRDYLGAMQITRETHRCPSFINSRDNDLAQINHKLDVLAGLFAQSKALEATLSEGEAA